MNELSALVKEMPESSLLRSFMGGHSKKMAVCEQESRVSPDTESARTSNLDFPASRIVRINVCCFSHLVYYGIYVISL